MRYEIKYVFAPGHADAVLKTVLRSSYLFKEIYHERQVNNIYLDTPGLSDYRDSVNGASNRSKTRIRWYGPLQQRCEPMLEIKRKNGMAGTKKGFLLPEIVFGRTFDYRQYAERIRAIGGDSLAFFSELRIKCPSIVNTYHRRYFATPDALCRVTIDWAMRFYGLPEAKLSDNFYISDPNIVLEIKFKESDLQRVLPFIQSFGYRIGKNSKYVNGVNAVYSGVR
ncbi:VTC domain-containing protein [Synergistales bacterium]|nr:VTC domain-containing protein [Synergistales bacterium]